MLTIHNLNNTQVKIFKGQAVAQVMFTRVLVPTFTVTNLALPGAADVAVTTTFGAMGRRRRTIDRKRRERKGSHRTT